MPRCKFMHNLSCEQVSDRIIELEDENAELREQGERLFDKTLELGTENTKLRELVRNLHACNGSCPRCIELMGRCEYGEQLGELGIEVEP